MLSLLKEFLAYKNFFAPDHRTHRQLVFYSERDIYWQTLGPFAEAFLQSEPQATCSYITSDPNDPILTRHHERLFPFYFNYLLKAVFDRMDAECFVLTMPDLNTFHLKKSKHTREYVYLFHAFSSTHLQYNEQAFDAYDTVFCVGPHHEAEIRKREQMCRLPAKNLIPVGYPRMDAIFQKNQHYKKQFNQTTVLVAPTWSIASLFENGINELLDALEKTDYRVIVRPHPEFLKRRSSLAKTLKERVTQTRNFIWEDCMLSENNLYEADVLITDRSGIAFEYAFGTERPVLFIDTPLKEHNKNWRTLGIEPIELQLRDKIGISVPLQRLSEVPDEIENLLRNRSDWREILKNLREKHVYHWGYSVKNGVNYIRERLKK